MDENSFKGVELSHNSQNNRKFYGKLLELRAATYVVGFFGAALIVGAFISAYVLVHPGATKTHNLPLADLTLVNSASPSPSPLIYGTNLAMDNSSDQFLSNSGAAAALQGLHAQLVRMPIRDQLTTADYTTALTKIKQIGATPLLIVHGAVYSGGDPYPKDSALLTLAKSIFPTQTVYVDFGNEEDLGGASVQAYVSGQFGWNNEIPKLKTLAGSNFKFGGPVNFQYNQQYIDTFVSTANPAPDYVVWHAYAGSCGHNRAQDSQASMLASINNWDAHIQQISNDFASMNGGAHKGMPLIIDEWNYASDLGVTAPPPAASPCYSNDQNFINAFFNKAFTMFLADGKYGVIGTAEYEAFRGGADENMLDGSNNPTYQGQAFKASYEANIGNTPPPPPSPAYSCSGLDATVDASNSMLYNFAATAQVANGAVLNSGDINFGDGSSKAGIAPTGMNVMASHTYAAAGTFNAVATLHFTASNAPVTASCSAQVAVSGGGTNPTYSGTLNDTPNSSNPMLYQFVGNTATNGGATFTSADIAFGDGNSAAGLKPAAGGSSVQTNHTYAAAGTYTAKATFSFLVSGVTKTTAATAQVVISSSGGGGGGGGQTTAARDSFNRPNQSGWGTASDGQVWGADSSNGPVFSIRNNVGIISNTSNSLTGILGPSMTNSQVVFTARISQFNYSNFGAVVRYKDANNWYKAYLTGDDVVIQKRVNGTYATLKSVGFKANANTPYTVRFQAVGTALSVKVWDASGTEPAAWNTTATDSSLTSGYDGLRALPQTGIVVGYYYFKAYQL